MSRQQMIQDAATHLSDQIRDVFFRNLKVLRDAGHTPAEGIAVVMHAVDQLAFVTVGMAISSAEEGDREATAGKVMDLMSLQLRSRMPELLGTVQKAVRPDREATA